MPKFLEGSIVISLCIKIVNILINSYNHSVLKRFIGAVGICFKNSLCYKILSAYAHKKPWFRYSMTFKIIMFFARIFDRIFGFIYSVIKKCLFGSKTAYGCKSCAKMPIMDKCYGVGVLLVSMPIGAMAASLVFGTVTAMTMVLCWAIFIIGVMTVLVGVYGRDSIVVKFVKGFIAAIK